jgi:hypothetical protein
MHFVQQWCCYGKDIIKQVGDTNREAGNGGREADTRRPDRPFGRK